MEILINVEIKEDVAKVHAELIDLCTNNVTWSYKKYSMYEEAIVKQVPVDLDNNTMRTIAFLVEERDDSILLVPARVRGEALIPPDIIRHSIVEIIDLLINNIWDMIITISVTKV